MTEGRREGGGIGGFFRYDGRLKSETNRAFGREEDGNAFEIFFLTLFVLESVGVRCRREIKDFDEDDKDFDKLLSLQNRWRDFLHVLFPTILCVFHPKLSLSLIHI